MDKEKTFLYVIIALITLLLCTTVSTCVYKYKYDKLVSENGRMLELARERAAVLTDTITRAAETNRELGESLSRQRTSVTELRKLISEIRTKYEKMEELLNSSWDNYSDAWNIDSCVGISNGEQVE